MITAIDTNVLLDILLRADDFCDASFAALESAAANSEALTVCDIVYAELCVHFASRQECDSFLQEADIRVERLTRDAQFLAGRVWREYRKRGGKRTRILPDFLIGAHAQTQATRLLSRDRGFYRTAFSALELIDPSTSDSD